MGRVRSDIERLVEELILPAAAKLREMIDEAGDDIRTADRRKPGYMQPVGRGSSGDPTGNTVVNNERVNAAVEVADGHLQRAADIARSDAKIRDVLEALEAAEATLAAVDRSDRAIAEVERRARHRVTCEHCGAEFVAERATAKYCTPTHRVAAHRKRKDRTT